MKNYQSFLAILSFKGSDTASAYPGAAYTCLTRNQIRFHITELRKYYVKGTESVGKCTKLG